MDTSRSIKYGLDRALAVLFLVATSPLLLLIAFAVRLDSPGSPLFLQARVGEGGRSFTIFKFRTMRPGSEQQGLGSSTAADDARITRVGRLLRALSLDELPQLVNIALGEMSFIGPRPTLRYQVEAYTPEQRRRLLFRPGITGWAQVNGRNRIPWAQRIQYDIEYVDRYSLGLDLRVLWRTCVVLLRGDGIYATGSTNDTFVVEPGEAASRAQDGPTPLLVVGAGGHARVALDVAEKQGLYQIVGLLDESPARAGGRVLDYPVLGGRELLSRPDVPRTAFVAIGNPGAREAWQNHLESRGFDIAVLVHPSAQVGRDVVIGPGSVLMAGSVVNSGARLGRGVIVNTGASVDHDCEIADFVHVAPGARLAGGVRVGPRAHIGIGSCVLQNLTIGAAAVVGGGAAVVRPVPAGTTVAGVPARPLHSPARLPEPQHDVART